MVGQKLPIFWSRLNRVDILFLVKIYPNQKLIGDLLISLLNKIILKLIDLFPKKLPTLDALRVLEDHFRRLEDTVEQRDEGIRSEPTTLMPLAKKFRSFHFFLEISHFSATPNWTLCDNFIAAPSPSRFASECVEQRRTVTKRIQILVDHQKYGNLMRTQQNARKRKSFTTKSIYAKPIWPITKFLPR